MLGPVEPVGNWIDRSKPTKEKADRKQEKKPKQRGRNDQERKKPVDHKIDVTV